MAGGGRNDRGFLHKPSGIGRIIDQIRETCTMGRGQTGWPTNKNAQHCCEAFGAENETRTISCNVLIISDLKETEKTSGET